MTSSLLDHYDVRSGLSKPAKDFGTGYPFLTFKDVFYNYFTPEQLGDFVQSTQKDRESCSVLRGDVFLTRTSETMHELGMSCVALRDYKDATFNGFCKRLRPKPDSDLLPEYVGYYLRSPKFRQAMLALSTMSTRASLNSEMIGRLEISFPSRHVQSQISEILKSLDDRIALLRETNVTLEAIAQALFKSWFVDFDPVRAKMEGRLPEGMDETTAALFPDGLEESELGTVPIGWAVGVLGDILKLRNERVQPSENTALLPYVPIENISAKFPFLQAFKSGQDANSSLTLFYKGDVLFGAMRPYFHKVCSAPFDGVTRTTVFTLTPNNPNVGVFALFQAYQDSTIQYATQHSEGSTIPYAKWRNSMELMPLFIPAEPIQMAFSSVVSSFVERANSNILQAQNLAALRDTLLPRLISGQLRLTEVEAGIDAISA